MDSRNHGLYKQNQDGEEFTGDEDTKTRVLRHIEKINGGLKPGAKITVVGQVLPNVRRIDFDLCEHANGNPKILHFNPRFDPSYIVRNSLSTQGWGPEETESGGRFPFKKGSTVKWVARCEKDRFSFTIDDTEFVEYKYRQDISKAKYLRVLGGISIIHVDIRN